MMREVGRTLSKHQIEVVEQMRKLDSNLTDDLLACPSPSLLNHYFKNEESKFCLSKLKRSHLSSLIHSQFIHSLPHLVTSTLPSSSLVSCLQKHWENVSHVDALVVGERGKGVKSVKRIIDGNPSSSSPYHDLSYSISTKDEEFIKGISCLERGLKIPTPIIKDGSNENISSFENDGIEYERLLTNWMDSTHSKHSPLSPSLFLHYPAILNMRDQLSNQNLIEEESSTKNNNGDNK